MIRSHARQRTTPCTAGIGPSSTIRERNALCASVSLLGPPGDGLLPRPSHPCSLNRITQSRNVCRSMPPILRVNCRQAPPQSPTVAAPARRPSPVLPTHEALGLYSPTAPQWLSPWQTILRLPC